MSVQRVVVREGPLADAALVWLLARVGPHVGFEVRQLRPHVGADVAGEAPLVGVGPHMGIEVLFDIGPERTKGALE